MLELAFIAQPGEMTLQNEGKYTNRRICRKAKSPNSLQTSRSRGLCFYTVPLEKLKRYDKEFTNIALHGARDMDQGTKNERS